MPPAPQLPDFDPFAVLGVDPDTPPDEVKAAWRRLAKEHHPDAGGSELSIKRINVAYEWLRDPSLRQLLLEARMARVARPAWSPDNAWGPGSAWAQGAVWPVDPDAVRQEPAPREAYDGPRAGSIEEIAARIGSASMGRLLDLVHGWQPDLRWSIGLAQAAEMARRAPDAADAVWQVRSAVRTRLDALLEDPATAAMYDDELVGQVVSDRLADLARGIVLLDLLSGDARSRVMAEWDAVMGLAAAPPGQDVALPGPVGPVTMARGRWSRIPDGFQWLLLVLAAAAWAALMVVLLPSREAFAFILLGYAAVGVLAFRARRPAGR